MTLPANVRLPTESTLRRYALTLEEWIAYIPDGVCPVCGKCPPSGRFVVDHEHVRGWKKMPPEERRKYVRGVVCVTCNHFVLTRYGTPEKFEAASVYLREYEERRRRG